MVKLHHPKKSQQSHMGFGFHFETDRSLAGERIVKGSSIPASVAAN